MYTYSCNLASLNLRGTVKKIVSLFHMEESVSIEKMEGKNLGKMTANSLDFQDTQDL